MNKKLRLLLATTLSAVAVVSAAGATLAVASTDNASSGSLSTANLKLTAQAENVSAYTMIPAAETDEGAFEADGAFYKYQTGVNRDSFVDFYHGGGSVGNDGKSITITGFLPGDKVEFDIVVKSASTISFNYRAELYVNADAGETLLNQLEFTAGDLAVRHRSVEGAAGEDSELAAAVVTDYTEWKPVGGNHTNVEKIRVGITFPFDATEGADQTVKFYYVARGIQYTEEQPDIAEVTVNGAAQSFKMLADAVSYAEENGVSEIKIVDSALIEEGTVNVSQALRFVGVKKGEELPKLNGARFVVADGAGVSFENVRFDGDSYIDVSGATALSLKNCVADVAAEKYFDAVTRTFLPEAAFLVSGSSPAPVRLNLENCTIASEGGASVCLRSRLRNGSVFAGNTFCLPTDPFTDGTAVLLGGAENGAVVTFTDNAFYAGLPLSLGNGWADGSFKVVSTQNRASEAKGFFVGGTANAVFFDNGSTVNGGALTVENIATDGLLVGGADVTLNDMARAVSGKFKLGTATVGSFYFGFVAVEPLETNAVVIYRGGIPYSYLNSNGESFVETVI